MALEDARSDGVGYLRGGVRCLIRDGKGGSILRQVQDFTEPSMRIGPVDVFKDNKGVIKPAVNKHTSRRTKHIDMKHHFARDLCDAGKVRVVYVKEED